MRILVVAPQPFYEERGTPIAVRLLVETLCDFGHDVDLLVYQQGQDIEFPRLRIVACRASARHPARADRILVAEAGVRRSGWPRR